MIHEAGKNINAVEYMECRVGCAACCIAPSISTPIPGMPDGKAAGLRCVQLTTDNRCRLFGLAERPKVCISLRPSPEMCGESDSEAMENISRMEYATRPECRELA
jgi:Fe-S-cluster containining protein